MNKTELRKMFPYICKEELDYEVENNGYKTERGFVNHLVNINAEHCAKASKPEISSMTIKIDWKKSAVCGFNPYAKAWVHYADGTHEFLDNITCGGYGYDKQSTVVAHIFNRVACGMLYRRRKTRKKIPYGICLNRWFPSFDGGIGIDCYSRIAKFLGGEMKYVSWSDTFDHYEFKFKVKNNGKTGNN